MRSSADAKRGQPALPERDASRQKPSAASERYSRREKAQSIAVGEPRHRRFRRPRSFNEIDDPSIGAVSGGLRRFEIEGRARIGHAARDRATGLVPHRRGLARQSGLIEDSRNPSHESVHRDRLARADQEAIAGLCLLNRNCFEAIGAPKLRRSGHTAEQRLHLTVSGALRVTFERLTTGKHHRDHDTGQIFAARERASHRERGDYVEPDLAPPEARYGCHDEDEEHRRTHSASVKSLGYRNWLRSYRPRFSLVHISHLDRITKRRVNHKRFK